MSLSLSIYVYTQSGIPTQLANITRSAPSGVNVNCYPSPTAHLTTTYTWSALGYGCPNGFSFSSAKGSNATCIWTSTRPAVNLTWNCLYTIAGGLKTITGSGGTTTLTSTPRTRYITVTQTVQSTVTSTNNLAPGGITQTLTSTITQAPVAPRYIAQEKELKELEPVDREPEEKLPERQVAALDLLVPRDEGNYLEEWARPGPRRIRSANEMITDFSSPLLERACSAVDILCPGGQCCSSNNSMCVGTVSCCDGFGCVPFSPAASFEKAIVPKVQFLTVTSYSLISVKTTAAVTATTSIYTIVTDIETQTVVLTTSASAALVLTTITGKPQVIVVNNAGSIVGGVVGGIAGITMISAGIFFFFSRRRYRRGYKPPSIQQQTLLGGGNYQDSHYYGAGSNYPMGLPNANAVPEGYGYAGNPQRTGLMGVGGMLAAPYQRLGTNSGAGGRDPYLDDPTFRQQAIRGQGAYDPAPTVPAAAFAPATGPAAIQQRTQYQEYPQYPQPQQQLQNPQTQAIQTQQYQQYHPQYPQPQQQLQNPQSQAIQPQQYQQYYAQPQNMLNQYPGATARAVDAPSTGATYQDRIPSNPSTSIAAQRSSNSLQVPISFPTSSPSSINRNNHGPLECQQSVAPSMTSTYQPYHTPIPSSVEASFALDHNPPTGRRYNDPRDRHIPGQSPTFEIHEMIEFPQARQAPRYF